MKMKSVLSIWLIISTGAQAFVFPATRSNSMVSGKIIMHSSSNDLEETMDTNRRRATISLLVGGVSGIPLASVAEENYAPKFVQSYEDFALTDEGWSFRDVKVGNGESPKVGDRGKFVRTIHTRLE